MGQIIAGRITSNSFSVRIRFVLIKVWQPGRRGGFGFQIGQESQRHGQVVKTRIVVIANIGADPVFPPPFFPACFIAEVDVIIKAVPALPGGWLPVRPAFTERVFQFIARQVQRPKLILLHIRQRGVAGMIHDDIKQDANAALVRAVNQRTQVSFITHIRVERGPVLSVIAVVSIMGEIAFGATADPAVDLLKRRADPQGVDA